MLASDCFHQNTKKKVSSTSVNPTPPNTTTNTTTNKGAQEGATQKKEDNIVKKDTLATVVDSKSTITEYPVLTDTLKFVKSGYFLLKEEVEVLKTEINALKAENIAIKEDTKALKIELENLMKEKEKK